MKKLILALIFALALSGCGKDGKNGTNGTNGIDGAPGATGPQGPAGSDGVGCEVTSVAPGPSAPNGGSLISCASSSSLVLNGTNGTDGAPGTPGTVIQSIQLCPGTTVYPSKFIEVAFCMNNTLYGVYSANDGFMTELPPGTYGSNGINASCNFTIAANCVVNH